MQDLERHRTTGMMRESRNLTEGRQWKKLDCSDSAAETPPVQFNLGRTAEFRAKPDWLKADDTCVTQTNRFLRISEARKSKTSRCETDVFKNGRSSKF